MSQQRKATHRKSSSSDVNLRLNNAQGSQSSTGFSNKKTMYPNVPKRKRQDSSTNQHDPALEPIDTESRICFIPSPTKLNANDEYASRISPFNQNAQRRHNLDLISKYTASQELSHSDPQPSETRIHMSSSSQPAIGSKNKRCLSPLNEINQHNYESKRTKSFHEVEDDDDELSQLLDHRHRKTTISTQPNNESESREVTRRKSTARKLSTSQQSSKISPPTSFSQPILRSRQIGQQPLVIELDVDPEDHEKISNTEHYDYTEPEDHINQSLSSSTPIKPLVDHSMVAFNPKTNQTSARSSLKNGIANRSLLNAVIKQTLINSLDHSPPGSHVEGRRFSSASSSSLIFDTPRSSISRTTTSQMMSTSPTVMKSDSETHMTSLSNMEMITQLISQTRLNATDDQPTIDYNPIELSTQLFRQSSNTNSPTRHSPGKQQVLRIGRYEIEVRFPIDNAKLSTIHACDLCFKHFHGSSMASQRHAAKCLYTRPPGHLILDENDLAIFQIGETQMNIQQRIYIKSLSRIARLFIDSTQSFDDTKIDRFAYYILCRRDPSLSQSQSCLYRFVGYFSQQLHQHTQQLIPNLSCLFILPPFAHRQDYNQLLITLSYFLIQSNASETIHYTSPARPFDRITHLAFQNYWRDTIFAYLINSQQSITLDTLARQTFIDPRDILFSLYSNRYLVSHPTDKSSVYLVNYGHRSINILSCPMKTKLLDIIHKKKRPIGQQNHDNGLDEIVLD